MLNDRFASLKRAFSPSKPFQKPTKANFKIRDLKFFFQFVKPVWKIGAFSLFLVIISSGINALIPLTPKIFIDFILNKTGYDGVEKILEFLGLKAYSPIVIEHLGSINFVIASMIVIGTIYCIINIVQTYTASIYQQELAFNLQTRLFDHVLRFPMSILKNKQTGYLMSRISDDVNFMQYLFSNALTMLLSNIFYLIFSFAILLWINAYITIATFAILPIYILVRAVFFGRIRNLSYQEREYNSEVSRDMQEVISGAELVKSFATEKKETAKISNKLRVVMNTRISLSVMVALASTFMPAVMFAIIIGILYVGTINIQNHVMSLGDLSTILTYFMFLSTSINNLYRTYLSLQPAFASMDRLKEMFNIDAEFDWNNKGNPLKKLDHVKGEIRFEGVSFSYNDNELVLSDINFIVNPGESVALVGHSGAGKTTIASMILKLYRPKSGNIYLDGINLNDLDHTWLRQQISIVSQDIFLFNDTIENNIKYGQSEKTHEEVVNVAKKAYIHEFIEKLPDGYNTLIGERGIKLSVGQRQRISIARAFLRKTPILILDEPTSSIDPETEQYLKISLEELMKGRTTLIISHRMSLTEIAGQVIAIDNGKIAQIGTKEELVNNGGLYDRLKNIDKVHVQGV